MTRAHEAGQRLHVALRGKAPLRAESSGSRLFMILTPAAGLLIGILMALAYWSDAPGEARYYDLAILRIGVLGLLLLGGGLLVAPASRKFGLAMVLSGALMWGAFKATLFLVGAE